MKVHLSAFQLLIAIVIFTGSTGKQLTVREIEAKLTGGSTRQWVWKERRETLGDEKCEKDWLLTFIKSPKKVQQKKCEQSVWNTTVKSWSVRIAGNNEPDLLFDNQVAYKIRFIHQDGDELLRLTEAGKQPDQPTRHNYFKVSQ